MIGRQRRGDLNVDFPKKDFTRFSDGFGFTFRPQRDFHAFVFNFFYNSGRVRFTCTYL